jgi:hypothetical protein
LATYLLLLCSLLRNALRSRHDLLLENLALRHQLSVLSRRKQRPRLSPADRLFWSGLSRIWSDWRSALVLVRPETVIRWQHNAWRQYWTWRSRHRQPLGRPRVPVGRQYSIRLWAGQEVTHPSSLRCTSMTRWCLTASPDASACQCSRYRWGFATPQADAEFCSSR